MTKLKFQTPKYVDIAENIFTKDRVAVKRNGRVIREVQYSRVALIEGIQPDKVRVEAFEIARRWATSNGYTDRAYPDGTFGG